MNMRLLSPVQRSSSRTPTTLGSVGISRVVLLCVAFVVCVLVQQAPARPLQSPTSQLQLPEDSREANESSVSRDGVDQSADYRGSDASYDYYDYYDNDTFTPLPPAFTPDTTPEGCFRHEEVTRYYYHYDPVTYKRTLRNYTEVVRKCCKGFSGDDCNQRVAEKPPTNCSNLVCEGNSEAICAVVFKCGQPIPLFVMPDWELAKCDNGQPSDMSRISCTPICSENPCAGQTCPSFPEAMCTINSCDCKPLWLLPEGVHVDCEVGKHLTPAESKRKRRQAVTPSEDEQDSTNCT